MQVVVRGMIERGQGGAIVNISSMTTNVAFPEHTSYCSSKGAVDTLTRVMALELGPHQVIVHFPKTTTAVSFSVHAFSRLQKIQLIYETTYLPRCKFQETRHYSILLGIHR